MRFKAIQEKKERGSVARWCRVLQVSRSGYYAAVKRPESARRQQDHRLRVMCRESFEQSRRNYGSPRIHDDLKEQGERLSRKRVIRLMREDGIRVLPRRKFVRTTDSKHPFPIAPNLLSRDFGAQGPNQKWAGDITYLKTPHGWLYLAIVLDLFSRRIVGWATSSMIDRHLVIQALNGALRSRRPQPGLLYHSDRGSQYACRDYQTRLAEAGIICSMSGKGDCYDNAVVESCFKTIKAELGDHFCSAEEANQQLFDYIETFYNQRRKHSALGYLSPALYEARQLLAA